MADRAGPGPAIFTIAPGLPFADALARGLIERLRRDPLGLARGRILLPNNRAVRTLTEAFVRASGTGLLLPRLIPIGDPELDDRMGGALDPIGDAQDLLAPAIDPGERLLVLARIVSRGGERGAAESLRLAGDLARTIDALQIEQIAPADLRAGADDAPDLSHHWAKSLRELDAIITHWPGILAERGVIDLSERRNRLLERLAKRWGKAPPPAFTIAAGITTAAPAVAALLATISSMERGEVVLPGLWLDDLMPDAEWEALGGAEGQREPAHPQYHLKQLLDRMGVKRGEVSAWPDAPTESRSNRAAAIANAMTAPGFSDKWETLAPAERRLKHVRLAQFPSAASEAQGIALAMRGALETPGRTAALVTPDRQLAVRVSALLGRWGIEADDSAGRPLSQTAAGSFLLAIAAAAATDISPVATMAALKHPFAGGMDEERRTWLDRVRRLDLALRGPRPGPGLAGIDRHIEALEAKRFPRAREDWASVRPFLEPLDQMFGAPSLAGLSATLVSVAQAMAGDRAWAGSDGRAVAEMLASWQEMPGAELALGPDDAVPALRQLLDRQAIRPPYGQHPRLFIWGLLEARLQRADLMILGGLNEGVWPALPAPDPWLPPRIRAKLGMPTLETRIGLSAHDFASALEADDVLITRARRDSRSPTVASRFWLRLRAIDPELQLDTQLPALATAIDAPENVRPADRPAPVPSPAQRPRKLSVTSVDRLTADPFAFYARSILRLPRLDSLDLDPTAAWKGTAVHEVLERWFEEDDCDPATLIPRAEAMLRSEAVHPLLRAMWRPRLLEAVEWVARQIVADRDDGRLPIAAEIEGESEIDGIMLSGKADRIDRQADGSIAIIDYKTGSAPTYRAIDNGFALQLGLLGLIAGRNGFEGISGRAATFEYWSFAGGGKRVIADKNIDDFLAHTAAIFRDAAARWLTGNEPFTAKLNPAFAPYGDYDQLMRLEEWYGRQ